MLPLCAGPLTNQAELTLVAYCLAMEKEICNYLTLLIVATLLGYGSCSQLEQGLANRHLKIVAVPWKPFLGWKCPNDTSWSDAWETDCPNGEDRMYNGILWDLLMIMRKKRNFSYTMMGIDDAWWGGTCYDSNNCTGMVGRVNRHEADIALGSWNVAEY